jgi:hypothetical protein
MHGSPAIAWAVGAQVALVSAAVAGLTILPPRQGSMLVLPLSPASDGSTTNWVIRAGASILATGPTPGSLVVLGNRDSLSMAALHHGSVVLAAPRRFCGSKD